MIQFSDKQISTINQDTKNIRMLLQEGTPRSGKTTADILMMAKFYVSSPDKNHLISAYNQEQAFRMFVDGDGFGLQHIYKNTAELKHDDHGDHLLLHAPNGDKKIYFKGGGKSNSVGAITGMSLGSVAFIEYNLLHKAFIEESFRRTFASKRRFHLAEQNPPAPNHPNLELLKRFEDAGTMHFRHWTPHDNPALSEERKTELYEELKGNPYLYKRDWLGERSMPDGVIYAMFDMTKHVKQSIAGRVVETFFTADAGQSDATTCAYYAVVLHEKQFYLYRIANYYHSGRDSNQTKAMSVYAKDILDFIKWTRLEYPDHPLASYYFVDPAAKSLREELHLLGVRTAGADNNSRDKVTSNGTKIEVGIERKQSLLIQGRYLLLEQNTAYDHYGFLKEIGMYSRNDNGYPIDKDNHAMDESRYAVNYFYKQYIRR